MRLQCIFAFNHLLSACIRRHAARTSLWLKPRAPYSGQEGIIPLSRDIAPQLQASRGLQLSRRKQHSNETTPAQFCKHIAFIQICLLLAERAGRWTWGPRQTWSCAYSAGVSPLPRRVSPAAWPSTAGQQNTQTLNVFRCKLARWRARKEQRRRSLSMCSLTRVAVRAVLFALHHSHRHAFPA